LCRFFYSKTYHGFQRNYESNKKLENLTQLEKCLIKLNILGLLVSSMKPNLSIPVLIVLASSISLFGQVPDPGFGLGAPPTAPIPPSVPPPSAYGAPAPYTGMAPTVSAPPMGSPYAGPTLADPMAQQPMSYGYQQPASTNSWGSTVQQSMGGAAPMLNYRYIEVGYRFVDPKLEGANGSHGIGIALVMDLPTMFFLKGTFNWTSGAGEATTKSARDAEDTLSTITIGGGVYMPITQKLHFVGEVGLVYANFDAEELRKSYTDGGIYIRPGLRYQVVEWMEVQAGVTVSSASDYDSKVFDLGGYFRVMPQLDVNIGADFGDQTRTFKAGGRLRW